MNHVYRLKRSGRTQQLQPVPENTRSAGKGVASTGKTLGQSVGGTLTSFALSGIAALLHAQQAPPTANMLPQGGVVSRGSASINTSTTAAGNALMTVNQTSNRAVIDWNSFNVGASAKVQFNQPGSNSVVLNQILGNNASQIYGQISANGQVFLSNPNGVYFSPTASVNVGALVAKA
jgi:filamentous hemagglutinin family protein